MCISIFFSFIIAVLINYTLYTNKKFNILHLSYSLAITHYTLNIIYFPSFLSRKKRLFILIKNNIFQLKKIYVYLISIYYPMASDRYILIDFINIVHFFLFRMDSFIYLYFVLHTFIRSIEQD